MKPRIAIVVQRYGEEVNGGAEVAARWLAERLTSLAEVHVITTCALDFTTWADHYPPGESQLQGVRLHRFPVDKPRDWLAAQRRTGELLHSQHSILDELAWAQEQGPLSTPLLQFIEASESRFDLFIFVTYIYATTLFGLPLVSRKAILLPAAHDEPYLYLSVFRPLFHLPRILVHFTEAEKMLVQRVTQTTVPQLVAGVGIDPPPEASGERFRQKYGVTEPFIIYAGRINEAKNVPELLDFFLRFRQQTQRPLKLVLLGKADIPLPDDEAIIPLGFVSEQDKFDAIQAADLMIAPSLYESLSIVILESWLVETAVLVNGRCEVLKQQCRASQGGLYYHGYDEFQLTLSRLLDNPSLRRQLGRQGRQFVHKNYRWDVILAKYQAIFDIVCAA
jgi:glycosyltransferase involved in cell wall biosynthesis